MKLTLSHPFWSVSNGLPTNYPSLQRDVACDAVVIGGGITGALVAVHLVETGVKTLLIDKRDIGTGSTSASTALLQYEIDVPLREMITRVGPAAATRSYRLCHGAIGKLERLAARLKIDCGFRRKPSLFLARHRREIPELREEFRLRREMGIELEFFDASAVRKRFPFSRPAALLSLDGGQIDPHRLTHGLLAAGKQVDLEVCDRSEMRRMEHTRRGVRITTKNGFHITARRAVIAAGFESKALLRSEAGTRGAHVPSSSCNSRRSSRLSSERRNSAAPHFPIANSPTQSAYSMTKLTTSREIQLASRPKGIPTAANFTLAQTTLPPLQAQQVLVRNLFMSVDPYMRGRMNEGKSYVPAFAIGQALEGGAIGEVVESRASEFKPGDLITSRYGWREAFVAAPKELRAADKAAQPISAYLGTLGMTGMTAWAGLTLVEVKAGDVIFISGAAGAVGNVAGQLAKLRGCRVIGSAGSAEKVQILLDECGFDAAFNYKTGPTLEQLNRAAPDGIDVYFDNVGGESLEAALSALRLHGRIIACGGISSYNDEKPKPGPANLFNMTTKRLTMKGLIVGDWLDRQSEFEKEVGGYFRSGRLKNKETVVEGIDHAVDAFLGLFSGKNSGKMIVKLS